MVFNRILNPPARNFQIANLEERCVYLGTSGRQWYGD